MPRDVGPRRRNLVPLRFPPSDTNSSALVTIVNGTPDFGFSDPLADGTYEIRSAAPMNSATSVRRW